MIDAAIWLLRWTLAGAALAAIVITAAYVRERRGRSVGVSLFRTALLAALAGPILALAPPVFTFSTPGAASTQTNSLTLRFTGEDNVAVTAAGDARDKKLFATRRSFSASALAIPLLALWFSGAAFAAISRQQSSSRLSRAFRSGAPYPGSSIECRLSADAPTPLLFGVFRPRMLAPADFAEWSDAERAAVLRHEAAHARRGDLVWAFLGDVVCVLYWWAPPVRYLVSRHMLATEEACDAASFGRSEDRHDYARALLAVARRVGGHTSPGLAMTASSLRRRIESLTSPAAAASRTFGVPVVAAAAAAALMLALSGPVLAELTPFRIYIFDAAGGRSSTYALSDGESATAAIVERCVGRLAPNAAAIVDEIEARVDKDSEDDLSIVWIVGPGSKTNLGPCSAKDEHARDEDSLVLITDASEKQARSLIRQIHGLSRSQRRQMVRELGLSE